MSYAVGPLGGGLVMPPSELQPGDKVIELAALARSSAMITGAVLLEVIAWLLKLSVLLCFATLVAGAVVGWFIGMIVGKCLYPVTTGNAVVVKTGGASLPAAFKAALPGALLVSLGAGLGFCSLITGPHLIIVAIAVGIGAIIGIISGILSAFL